MPRKRMDEIYSAKYVENEKKNDTFNEKREKCLAPFLGWDPSRAIINGKFKIKIIGNIHPFLSVFFSNPCEYF